MSGLLPILYIRSHTSGDLPRAGLDPVPSAQYTSSHAQYQDLVSTLQVLTLTLALLTCYTAGQDKALPHATSRERPHLMSQADEAGSGRLELTGLSIGPPENKNLGHLQPAFSF